MNSEALTDTRMVFVCAGLGGATDPARRRTSHTWREAGALVIAFVTLPFTFEGKRGHPGARASALNEIAHQ